MSTTTSAQTASVPSHIIAFNLKLDRLYEIPTQDPIYVADSGTLGLHLKCHAIGSDKFLNATIPHFILDSDDPRVSGLTELIITTRFQNTQEEGLKRCEHARLTCLEIDRIIDHIENAPSLAAGIQMQDPRDYYIGGRGGYDDGELAKTPNCAWMHENATTRGYGYSYDKESEQNKRIQRGLDSAWEQWPRGTHTATGLAISNVIERIRQTDRRVHRVLSRFYNENDTNKIPSWLRVEESI